MNTSIILPPNVSGFHNADSPAPALLSVEELQNYCEVASQGNAYSFVRFIDLTEQVDRSYHLALIEKEGIQYLIFLNKYRKVVAFSQLEEGFPSNYTGTTEMPRNRYIDLADLSAAFADHFVVLPVAILTMPIDADIPESAEVVQELEHVEFGEFSYYVPQNIGQVVFNGWKKSK